jgi:hypothetical protein
MLTHYLHVDLLMSVCTRHLAIIKCRSVFKLWLEICVVLQIIVNLEINVLCFHSLSKVVMRKKFKTVRNSWVKFGYLGWRRVEAYGHFRILKGLSYRRMISSVWSPKRKIEPLDKIVIRQRFLLYNYVKQSASEDTVDCRSYW